MTTPLKHFSVSPGSATKKGTKPPVTKVITKGHTFYPYHFNPYGGQRKLDEKKKIDAFVNEIGKKFKDHPEVIKSKVYELLEILRGSYNFDAEGVQYLLTEEQNDL